MNISQTAGAIVFWSNSFEPCPLDVVENAFARHCPELQHLLPEKSVDDKTAFVRSYNRCLAKVGKSVNGEAKLDRHLDETDDEVIATFGRVRVDGNKEFSSDHETTVVFVKATSEIIASDPTSPPVAKLIKTFNDERSMVTARDSYSFLPKMFRELHGVPLKKQGAIYFIPSPYTDNVDGLNKALANTGLNLVNIPINHAMLSANGGSDPTNLDGAISDGVMQSIDDLEKKVTAAISSGKARPSTVVKRFEDLESLKSHAMIFADVLKDKIDDVMVLADKVEKSIEDLESQVFSDEVAA